MKNLALITGASSGIGAELARLHATRGGDLALTARRADRLDALAEELTRAHGVRVLTLPEDLADEAAPARIRERLAAEGALPDLLVNNAGFALRGRFHEQDWTRNREMIQVNTVAPAALARAFLPDFVARGSGRILNVASTAALMPGPLQAVYFASKSFLLSFGCALAEELRDTGVTVTTLLPGATESEFAATSGMDRTPLFDRTTPAAEVARIGYEAMMAGKLEVFAGVTPRRRLLMRLAPLLPRRFVLESVRKLQEARPG
ncbi:MAG: SDR family oxidoreductase [Pseudomonadota bacterium]|nr:SDR family oxidoreductase [Pseudomonadota bacterium]MEE3098362.1 SDR family oxidoreductase [Pseudomonadota bacterium]